MSSIPSKSVAADLAALDAKVNAFLPSQYQHCYGSVSPTSMGSAGLKYAPDGQVAWDQVWTSFCDLALAGGPPHRGKLLEPVALADVTAEPARYQAVVAEIERAVRLTTRLSVEAGYALGWVGLRAESVAEAAWLQFAITAENVSARRRQAVLQVPAGPAFLVEKEIKNVVVAVAKSYHYWDGHLTYTQQRLAGENVWEGASPAEAATSPAEYEAAMVEMEKNLRSAGVSTTPRRYTGWVGVQLADEAEAVWMLRAVLAEQVLARREDRVLYFPVNPAPTANHSARVGWAFGRAWELWKASTARRRAW